MMNTSVRCKRFDLGRCMVLATTFLLPVLCQAGCRTATSLGLPLSSGVNYLLADAVKVRQGVGHRTDVATELAKATLRPHEIEAGDVLVIEPNDFSSPIQIPSDHTVQQDGTIDIGKYGRLQVTGKTVPMVQAEVQRIVQHLEIRRIESQIALASHQDSKKERQEIPDLGVAVRLISNERGAVYVMGEVNAPGAYPIVGSETALDALISAGGLSGRANEHKIILTRPQHSDQPRVILPVCYQQILQLGDVSTNYQLQPGDRIYVPSLTLFEDIKASNPFRRERSCPHCRDYSK